jgi:hypothetical protein
MKRSGGWKSRVACNFSPPSRPRACVLPLQPFAGALETGASQRGRVALSPYSLRQPIRAEFGAGHLSAATRGESLTTFQFGAMRCAARNAKHTARVHAAGGAVPISAVPNRARSERKQISDHDAHERDAGDITPRTGSDAEMPSFFLSLSRNFLSRRLIPLFALDAQMRSQRAVAYEIKFNGSSVGRRRPPARPRRVCLALSDIKSIIGRSAC